MLLDANLSLRLVPRLEPDFPGTTHVFECGDIARDDLLIWAFAKLNDFTIVSKDSDFHRMSFVLGHPPKVIWTRVGNAPTSAVESALRRNLGAIVAFESDAEAAFLIVEP